MIGCDLDTIIKIFCCHVVRIEGDKKNIEGNPKGLSNRFGSKVFVETLDYYLRKNKVEVKLKPDSDYIKLNSAYYDNSGNDPKRYKLTLDK